ncbi:MAG: glutathione S-transferase family protein [Oceanicoccus sp.]|uniref:glutathione S-transferase family protein n=2 Tax=Oceanicoccus sp. TaxID=2691044 RepID=UPI002629B30C|nr:glutathione S-transferase family protein [Oceanicoccus sp.]MCP3907950.1 glutathione S-transferase family protein [Oceanicoccus sp.]
MDAITLYAAPMSMYSGKVRAYFRKQGIAFNEVMPGHPSYGEKIIPQTKRGIVPVVELADGTVLQDTVDIIDHFEQSGQAKFSVYPKTPKQHLAALIIDLFGSEGLLKVAMHYRWNFLEHNKAFIELEFGDHIAPGAGPDVVRQVAEKVMKPMQAYLPLLGINEATIPAIEAQYLELLALLNKHFEQHPYLFGGQPCVADYSLMAPLYAHLSRDPYPGMIMKSQAQRVYRWVERMNAENADMPEYPGYPQQLFTDDEIPATLQAILSLIAKDFLPEVTCMVNEINQWLDNNPVEEGQCVTEKPRVKCIKQMDYPFRGNTITGMVIPYQLYMLQRITDYFDRCEQGDKSQVETFLTELDLQDFLLLKAQRRVERPRLIEVWGEAQDD